LYQRKYTICLKQKIDSINSLIEWNSEVEEEINVEDGFDNISLVSNDLNFTNF